MTGATPMRVHFDVSHPAHVHLFKHAVDELEAAGHETLVTSREKEVTTQLLDAYGIDHRPISAKGTSKLALASEWLVREVRLVRAARAFDPDVVVSHLNPAAVHAATVAGAEAVVCNDDEAAGGIVGGLTYPFASVVCTPSGFREDLDAPQRRYDGVHELAYLHPDRFEPDPELLRAYGVEPEEPYYVLRFVSWGAHHDVGQSGLTPEGKRELVEFLGERGEVYVSTEGDVPEDLAAHSVPVPPEDVHHLLSFADVYAGDSQTMALEAGVLGTPSVRSNSFAADGAMGHFAELAEHGLVESIGDEDAAVARVKELATDPDATDRWERRRQAYLEDAEDVTDVLLSVIREVGDATAETSLPPRPRPQA